jgi:hypothetical protein
METQNTTTTATQEATTEPQRATEKQEPEQTVYRPFKERPKAPSIENTGMSAEVREKVYDAANEAEHARNIIDAWLHTIYSTAEAIDGHGEDTNKTMLNSLYDQAYRLENIEEVVQNSIDQIYLALKWYKEA